MALTAASSICLSHAFAAPQCLPDDDLSFGDFVTSFISDRAFAFERSPEEVHEVRHGGGGGGVLARDGCWVCGCQISSNLKQELDKQLGVLSTAQQQFVLAEVVQHKWQQVAGWRAGSAGGAVCCCH